MYREVICRVIRRHSYSRARVWWDGEDFRASCSVCGRSMIKDYRGWRLFDPARDASTARAGHPINRM